MDFRVAIFLVVPLIFLLAAAVIIAALYWKTAPVREGLDYLHQEDAELGPAIISMIYHSAWARWYAAQALVNQGKPAGRDYLLQIASSVVLDKITDGALEVRGRLPGRIDYNPIDRTYWRSSALTFIKDPISLWKLIVIPRGGAEIEPSGNVIARNPVAAARTAQLINYDSLIVSARQFEKLWPKRDHLADKKRRRLLWRARWRRLDRDEIRRLS